MTATPDPAPAAEIAHVLFLDIVGYTRQTLEVQRRLVETLTRAVTTTPEYVRAAAAGEQIVVPSGDGMAVAFFRYADSPVKCALQTVRALPADFAVRIGVHSGPVARLVDATGKVNLSGDGINTAQRVMDCGDAGHILVSAAVVAILRQFDAWKNAFVELGVRTVKHDVPVHLFNFLAEGVGNPAVPTRFPLAPPMPDAAAPIPHPLHPTPSPEKTVAILYKRNAPHAAHLLQVLETGLKAAGYAVFIDRHLKIGVEWARELRRQVCAAYAVVPLLSAESIWSEMMEDEIVTAHEASGKQNGQPRLLPVRIGYEGPLPEAIHTAVGNLQYVLWNTPADDEPLVAELARALREPVTLPRRVDLESVGGAVPLDSKFYIARDTDAAFFHAVARRDSIVLVKGARQMGKTSLLTRGLQQAREAGTVCVRTDFQKLTTTDMADETAFFQTLAEMIADQREMPETPLVKWNASRTGAYNFERFLRRDVLTPSEVPIVWALDEVDKLFACPFGSDVFALFRSWHNDRAYEPDGPWAKLTMAIAYATEAHLFITDLNQSPFNVGTRLSLSDFQLSHVSELNTRYGSPLQTDSEIARFHALIGGQPYLTRRGLDHLVQHGASLTALEANAARDEGPFGDHLRRLLVSLSHDRETLEAVRGFLHGVPLPDSALFYRLRSGGLLSGSSEHDARLRCALYGTYLSHHLL